MPVPRLAALSLGLISWIGSAYAADLTPDQAAALEQQLRAWIVSVAGPNAPLPDRPIQVTPAGDHYAVAVPIKIGHDTFQFTASARPLDGGKWAIDDMHVPSPVEFTVDLPPSTKDDGTPNPMSGPVTYKLSFGQQSGQSLFDPSYATPSTFNSGMQDFNLSATAAHGQMTAHTDRSSSSGIMRPAADGRVDVLTDGSLDGYTITTRSSDAETLNIGIGRLRVKGEMDNLSRDRGAQIVQAFIQLGAAMPKTTGNAKAPPLKLDPKLVQTLLDAMADFASGFTLDETVERLSVDYGGSGAALSTARLGLAGKTDRGLLQAHMDLAMEGLTLRGLPLDGMDALIPTRLALRPAISGLSVTDLTRLLRDSKTGQTPPEADVAALFSHGGVSAGLESFAIDVAGASFAGMGKLQFTGPSTFTGTAQVTATNLDLLQQRVAANPALAQALPVFIFAKGIGRNVQDQIVWDVSYRNGQLLINNQDLSSMMGGSSDGGAKSPASPAQRPARPNRTR